MGSSSPEKGKNYIATYVDSLSPRALGELKGAILKNFDRFGCPRVERRRVKDIVVAAERRQNVATTQPEKAGRAIAVPLSPRKAK